MSISHRSKKQGGCLWPILLMSLFGSLGLLSLGLGIVGYWESLESNTWPTTDGVVVSSGIVNLSQTISGRRQYKAQVIYEYTVNGQVYTSDGVTYSDSFGSRGRAEATAARYQSDMPVTVYYAPDNPARAILETGPSSRQFMFMGVGMCNLAIPLLALLNFVRGRKV